MRVYVSPVQLSSKGSNLRFEVSRRDLVLYGGSQEKVRKTFLRRTKKYWPYRFPEAGEKELTPPKKAGMPKVCRFSLKKFFPLRSACNERRELDQTPPKPIDDSDILIRVRSRWTALARSPFLRPRPTQRRPDMDEQKERSTMGW